MKLTRKQSGAIAALIIALITGALYGPQDGTDKNHNDRATAKTTAHENTNFRDRSNQPQGIRRSNQRNVAGEFDYYALVLSWSPTFCATRDSKRPDRQCDIRNGRGYAFVLHGLWPQYKRGYPESCWTREKPFVPRRTIDQMLDIMPSRGLVIHEYKKHGTCSGLSPQNYYKVSRQFFNTINIPKRYVHPTQQQTVSPEQLKKEFIAINPGLTANMIAVSCRGSGNRLREVRFCFSKTGTPRACGRNETQKRLCSARSMFVPPVRTSNTRR